jgi:hypothetical protein
MTSYRRFLVVCAISTAILSALGWWLLYPEAHPYMHQHAVIFLPIGIVSTGTAIVLLIIARRRFS